MSAGEGPALGSCVRDCWLKLVIGLLGSPLTLIPVPRQELCAPQGCLYCFSSGEKEDLPLALLLHPHEIYSGAWLGTAVLSHTGLHLLVVAVQSFWLTMLKPGVG